MRARVPPVLLIVGMWTGPTRPRGRPRAQIACCGSSLQLLRGINPLARALGVSSGSSSQQYLGRNPPLLPSEAAPSPALHGQSECSQSRPGNAEIDPSTALIA